MAGTKTKKETVTTVTSIEELKQYSSGTLVELPCFAEGQHFVARLKRPSLLGMVKQRKIPNTLLVRANELFVQDGTTGFDPDEENMMEQMFDVLELMAKETFVEPTYSEIKDAGIELTDEQMMFIFNYAQLGVKALESFRTE